MKILPKPSHGVASVGEKDYLLVLLHSLRLQQFSQTGAAVSKEAQAALAEALAIEPNNRYLQLEMTQLANAGRHDAPATSLADRILRLLGGGKDSGKRHPD